MRVTKRWSQPVTNQGVSILLCTSVLFALTAANIHPSVSGVSSFFWLKPGTRAYYTFTADLFFDDQARGYPFRCNYSWLCLSVNYTYAVVDVNVNLELFQRPEWTTPAHVFYKGMEFVEKAQSGDLSFIKRIPMDQVVGRIEIFDDPSNPQVSIPSPIVIHQELTVTVDLDTMMMIDNEGQPWGKWILWIDPLRYPLEGNTEEVFFTNWLNRVVDVNVSYVPNAYVPFDTVFGSLNRYFRAVCSEPLEDPFLSQLGLGLVFISDWYEERTGIFLKSNTFTFIDDFLTQKLGIVAVASEDEDVHLANIVFVGDLNGDWQVNIVDLSIVAKAFGSAVGDSRWNQNADLNGDDVINIVDVTLAAKAFGTQYIIPD
jgi:hypothetical protein